MIYKYSISISGDNFYPDEVLNKIQGNFIINSYFKPTDKKQINVSEDYGYGSMSFWHPKKDSTEDEIIRYENDFIEFIEKNHYIFVENCANEFEIYIEIYFDGGQCNFEIFNKEILIKLVNIGVSLPISVYILKEEEIQVWENEVNLTWKTIT